MSILHNKRIIVEISKADELIMTIDENMLSCEFGALDRGNITDVADWGIYANRGSVSFIDKNGYFNNSNINSLELKGAKASIYLVKNDKVLISTLYVDDVEYNDATKQVDIQLISGLPKWQSKITKESIYPFYETYADEILNIICDRFGVEIISQETDFLGYKIRVDCPYIEPGNLWDIVNQVCQATMSRIIETEEGDAKITSCFPERTPIMVSPKNIIDIPQNDFVRIVNSSIQYRKITIYKNEVTESTKSHIRLNWGGYSTASVSGGANLGFTKPTPELSSNLDSEVFAYGYCIINTPHKIFAAYEIQTFLDTRKSVIGVTGTKNFEDKVQQKGSFFTSTDIYNESQIKLIADKALANTITKVGDDNTFTEKSVVGVETRVPIAGFDDNGTSEERQINTKYANEPIVQIPSSDLVREYSKYLTGDDTWVQLYKYILQEIKRRYEKGIECFEIECLFNEYVNESGEVVFDGKDLSQHFKRYDVIIPYVSKNGKTIPLRTNQDGTPKKFRIIGISYSYDGLLRQKLSVQEERYDVD